MKKTKKYVLTIIATIVTTLFLIAGFVWFIDPYAVFHAPFLDMGNYFEGTSTHYQVGGIIRNYKYDGLLVGTSMTESIHLSTVQKAFGGDVKRVIVYGGKSKDYYYFLKAIGESGKAKYILLGLDMGILPKLAGEFSKPDINDYVYEPSITSVAEYLWNGYVFEYETIRMLYTNLTNTVSNMDNFCIPDISEYNQNSVIKEISKTSRASEKTMLRYENRYIHNLGVLVDAIGLCNNTDIYIFIPPYSIGFWYSARSEGTDTMMLNYLQQLYERLLEYENVRICAKMMDIDTITNLSLYRDTNHYNSAVGDEIVNDIATGNFEITKDNIDEKFEEFRFYLNNYDWKAFEEMCFGNK